MHDFPDLLSDSVDDAAVTDVIEVGGGDTIAVTDHATHLYRSEGLLKDESIETFDHAVERITVRTKRRKSSIHLETIDSEASFTVPSEITDSVVESMMRGILLTNGVVSDDEDIAAIFRFSELTLIVTDQRLFEHVGSAVWDGDFETVEYADLSALDFERGSVATQVVLETRERRRRVKVPNEHAGTVRRVIQDAVFGFHDVGSIEELRTELADPDVEDPSGESSPSMETDRDVDAVATGSDPVDDDFVSAGWSPASDAGPVASSDRDDDRDGALRSTVASSSGETPSAPTANEPSAELDALVDRVDELSERVDRQTRLIESQRELIEQLVDELRRGR
ncbi:MAG: hypothetical protein RI568_03170 [Natronomonas sp.]|jgi:hypothetical protein|uniref:DUF7115 domain-containing protein n=1 Tax=Natronomonas salsuginis TaxID=2217661 RepID=A0A4U5JDT9_9EURY|nr:MULTISPECIES: hypothetical protein [Natronomonas]MDR9429690.1 hypothetical protein [Natronomonas sp.]TKR27530.1 hypothetical protein DM868_00065 [Natronomonas salsuginis]